VKAKLSRYRVAETLKNNLTPREVTGRLTVGENCLRCLIPWRADSNWMSQRAPALPAGAEMAQSATKSRFDDLECCTVGLLGKLCTVCSLLHGGGALPNEVSVSACWFRRVVRVSV
jgi:hypothetical protein